MAKREDARDLAKVIIDRETGTTRLHQMAEHGELHRLSNVTAKLLATTKNKRGVTVLHEAASSGSLSQVKKLTLDILASVIDDQGNRPIDAPFFEGTLGEIIDVTAKKLINIKNGYGRQLLIVQFHLGDENIKGVTAELLATVKSKSGNTPLHEQWCLLHTLPDATAELLATVKNNQGHTPLYVCAQHSALDQFTDITVEIAEQTGILKEALQPNQISCLLQDIAEAGTKYNHRQDIKEALTEFAAFLRKADQAKIDYAVPLLKRAHENGFNLPPMLLSQLL